MSEVGSPKATRSFFRRIMKGSRVANVSLLLAVTFACLALAEVSLRLLGWGQVMEYVPSDIWGYTMKPSQRVSSYGHPVMINSVGLRGPDFSPNKSPDTIRLLYVGDSVTYGGGRIRESDLFCRIAEENLKGDGYNVEVINLSAPGWSPQNWMRYIERNGLFEADVVVLVLPECDLTRGYGTMSTYMFVETAPAFRIVAIVEKLLSMFPKAGARRGHLPSPDPEDNLNANVSSVLSLKALCEKEHRVLLPVFIPTTPPVGHSRHWPRYEIVLSDVLDLRGPLDGDFFLDGVHLNRAGHRIVAENITQRLRNVLKERAY